MVKVKEFFIGDVTKKGDCCPECKTSWDNGDIYEHYLEAKFNPLHDMHETYSNKSLGEIKKIAKKYGWTEKNKKRFSKVIGIDCSMSLDANDDETYDGVSYWQCPDCKIAWHRFKGYRTEKFVTPNIGVIKEEEEKIIPAEYNPFGEIIYNAIQTPDGTILESTHRHDYVTHIDANGELYMVDGGQSYLKRSINKIQPKDLTLYLEPWSEEFHEKARKVVKRGGRGKDGMQPLTWVPICEMNDNWVIATIKYNTERGFSIDKSWFTNLLHMEMHYRNQHGITIKEN